jgi:hypothetical protein
MKKQLGQFYTTNYEYILQGIYIPESEKNIIEPFVGKGDLLNYIKCFQHIENVDTYDIDPKLNTNNYFFRLTNYKQDTLMNPPNYNDKFIITNPPYLARNKNKDKTLYDKYEVNDLYKCFILELCTNICNGGIIIAPTNFWCSIRVSDCKIREKFLTIYNVIRINMFEEKVFNDTTYAISAFQFEKRPDTIHINNIHVFIYPMIDILNKINVRLSIKNNFIIGGEMYQKKSINYKITRLTLKNKDSDCITNIVAKCIDDSSINMISLKISDELYLDSTENSSCRTYASLVIEPKIDKQTQICLVKKFNSYFEKKRAKYHSLFLTNYRESSDISRKRISFDLLYNLVGYVLDQYVKNEI